MTQLKSFIGFVFGWMGVVVLEVGGRGGRSRNGTAGSGIPQTVGFRPYSQLGTGSKASNPYWKWNLNSSLFKALSYFYITSESVKFP